MQLKPLYTVRFHYPKGWQVDVKGDAGLEEHDFFFAEGRLEGGITGVFRAANHPRKRVDGPYLMDIHGFVETDDRAVILLEYRGFGRAYPPGRRQVVGAAFHHSDHASYRRLNDSVCVIAGEVRRPEPPPVPLEQKHIQLVFSVAELIWEAPTD